MNRPTDRSPDPSFPAPSLASKLSGRDSRLKALIACQTELMGSEFDLRNALQRAADRARAITHSLSAYVELVEKDWLVYRAMSGPSPVEVGYRLPVQGTFSGLCVQTCSMLHCRDTENDPRIDPALARKAGARSVVVAPLTVEGRAIGVLKVVAREPDSFSEADLELLELMAGFIGVALVRAADHESRAALAQERENAITALAASEQRLRSLFDGAPVMMAQVMIEGDDVRIVTVNRVAEQFLSRPREQIVGRLATEVGFSRAIMDEALPNYRRADRTGQPVQWYPSHGEGAAKRLMSATVSPLGCETPGGPRHFFFFAEDITEATRLRRRADLAERMATVGRLAAGVAHEANNPLAYVISNLRFLEERLVRASSGAAPVEWSELREVAAEALDGAERVRRIVKDLSSFSHTDADVQREPVDLGAVVEKALALSGHELKFRARVVRELAPVPPVAGDSVRLCQVLVNLLVNAGHALPDGRSSENTITVRTGVLDDERVYVDVADNGHGIPAEVLEHIFEPFFTTKPVGQGTGLGLAICHGIIAAHGGELAVLETIPGRGTTFRVTLQIA